MKNTNRFQTAGSPAILLFLAAVLAAFPGAPALASTELHDQMEQALPESPTAEPAAGRRLLVFNLCKGFGHEVIPFAAETFRRMGEKTGAYEAVLSDDPEVFRPDTLRTFDAVLFNNTTGTLFDDPELKRSLMDFARSGGGVVGVHAATDAFYDWAEYGEMMGGYFAGHPWNAGDTVGIRLDDPGHMLNQAFGGRGFTITDEIYQFRDPYSRERLRILLTLDPARTDMAKEGMNREDGDYAVAWVRSWGEGRVFYCSLGHNLEVFTDWKVLQFYLDGIQFALGDLPADTTPSAALPEAHFAQSRADAARALPEALARSIERYTWGADPGDLEAMEALVVAALEPAEREPLAAALAGVLDSSRATSEAKLFACRMLYLVGDASAVPSLARLLGDDATAHKARYALERMDAPEVDVALIEACEEASPGARVGIVNTLGRRGARSAVPLLAALAAETGDPALRRAAFDALGNIGGPRAEQALLEALDGTGDSVKLAAAALAACGQRRLEAGAMRRARRIFEAIHDSDASPADRAAAVRGLAIARGTRDVPSVIDALADQDPLVRGAAADALREVVSDASAAQVAARADQLPVEVQARVIHVLSDRRHPGVGGLAAAGLESDSELVRVAAIESLAVSGTGDHARALARFAAHSSGDEASAARQALALLPASGVDEAIVDALEDSDGPVRVELLRALADRRAMTKVDAVMDRSNDPSEDVRAAAWNALAALPEALDTGTLLAMLAAETSESVRARGEAALTAVAEHHGPEATMAALETAKPGAPERPVLMRVLGQVGADDAVPLLHRAAGGEQAAEREAVVRVLAGWHSARPVPELLAIAETDPAQRAVALRGALQLLGRSRLGTPEERLGLYRKASALAESDDEKRLVLSGVSGLPVAGAMDVIRGYASEPALEQDVREALEMATVAAYEEQGITPIFRNDGIMVDGDLAEWRRRAIRLSSDDGRIDGFVRFAWSDDGLHISVQARDAAVQLEEDPEAMWMGDCLQLAVDPLLERTVGGYGPNSIELGLQQWEDGGRVHAWRLAEGTPESAVGDVELVARHSGQVTIYEATLPWSVLHPLEPGRDVRFGLNVSINDRDSADDWTAVEWSPGILHGKDPSAFNTVVLVEAD